MGLDTVQNYIIGIILFMVVIGSGVYMFGIFTLADSTIDTVGRVDEFNTKLNLAQNITTSVNKMEDNLNAVSASDTGVLGWLNALIGSAYEGIKVMWNGIKFMNYAIGDAGAMFGIPAFIISLILLIIIVIVIFAIWMAITKAG